MNSIIQIFWNVHILRKCVEKLETDIINDDKCPNIKLIKELQKIFQEANDKYD